MKSLMAPSPAATAAKEKKKEEEAAAAAHHQKIIKFNVGGTRYDVSKSLLEQHPTSMLCRIASDVWNNQQQQQEAAGGEIFIDRNGARFQYVLDYMRDARVTLPVSVPRAQLLADLTYFAIHHDAPDIVVGLVDDPKDLFPCLEACREYLSAKSEQLQKKEYDLAVEKLAHDIAKTVFLDVFSCKILPATGSALPSETSPFTFAFGGGYVGANSTRTVPLNSKMIEIKAPTMTGRRHEIEFVDLAAHLKQIGIRLEDLMYNAPDSIRVWFTIGAR